MEDIWRSKMIRTFFLTIEISGTGEGRRVKGRFMSGLTAPCPHANVPGGLTPDPDGMRPAHHGAGWFVPVEMGVCHNKYFLKADARV